MSDTIQHNFDDVLAKMLKRAEDYKQPLTDFYGYMLRRTTLMFRKLGRKGNAITFRDQLWPWFAPQYKRKDGTVVPAEGGISKVKGDGIIKGRLRHSGTRVTARSMIMADRGTMRNAVLARYRIGTHYATMKTPPRYAKFQNSLRRYMLITDDEVNVLRGMILRHLTNG